MVSRRERSIALYDRLIQVVHSIAKAGALELRDDGLTPAQYQLLVALETKPDAYQQHIGDLLGVTKGNVSMLVTRLESAGLVSRTPAGAAYLLRLTAEGRAVVRRLRPRHARFLAEQFDQLSDDELTELHRLLCGIGRRDS